MKKSKELEWLSKEVVKDENEILKHKSKLIQKITSVDKEIISNTIQETKPKSFGLLWRLKKVLGM